MKNQGPSLRGSFTSQKKKRCHATHCPRWLESISLAAMLVAFVASLALIAYGLHDELLDVVVWAG